MASQTKERTHHEQTAHGGDYDRLYLISHSSGSHLHVRFWPKADIGVCAAHVRFRGDPFRGTWEVPVVPQSYVLGPREGEHLILRGGDIFITVDPSKGSNGLATGTQQIPVGIGIPIHRHFDMDEAFYVIEGNGSLILDDVRHSIGKGASIFIPMNSWHGFENVSDELVLLWTVAPAGLECFFREIATRPGVPPIQRSKKQLNEIASKYGTEFR